MENVQSKIKSHIWPGKEEVGKIPPLTDALSGPSAEYADEITSHPATSAKIPKGKRLKRIKKLFGQLDGSENTTPSVQIRQDPPSDIPAQEATTPESHATGNVTSSADALIDHGEEAEADNVIKESGALAAQTSFSNIGMAKEGLDNAAHNNAKWVRVLERFKRVVDTVGGPLSNLSPIAQVAVGLLTNAAQTILDQNTRDESVSTLLVKVGEIYEFLNEEDTLQRINKKEHILLQIAQVVSNCSDFIAKYIAGKGFGTRLGKQFFDAQSDIDDFNKRLDALMQQYRDRAVRSIHINVSRLSDKFEIDGMMYAKGVGLMTTKKCLDGTREGILADIMDWINASNPHVPRMFWLHGQAGRGKSAIAHTIALWSKNARILGSCFCFARDRQAEHLERTLFATIAHDLANRDPLLRRAVVDAIAEDDSLKTTPDVIQQWEKLIQPSCVPKVSDVLVWKVVIVIDALDESGSATS
ncbi:hypothetical protein ID866_6689 [Astraeus odoratus]|nr:hypothetical protein ID866_6689 [Astraeus odoratus]